MMKHALLLSLGLLFAGCPDPTEGKPTAEVKDAPATPPPAEPTAAPTPPPPAAAGATVKATGADSKVEWTGAKVTKSHPGGFKDFTAEGKVDNGQLTSLNGTIQLGSIFADDPKLTDHLKSPDFFDVAANPTATFTSTAITPGGEGGASHTITGTLDLHGQKKEISFPATVTANPDGSANVKAEFGINRQDFGITYPGKPDDLIQDKVLVKIDLNLKP